MTTCTETVFFIIVKELAFPCVPGGKCSGSGETRTN